MDPTRAGVDTLLHVVVRQLWQVPAPMRAGTRTKYRSRAEGVASASKEKPIMKIKYLDKHIYIRLGNIESLI